MQAPVNTTDTITYMPCAVCRSATSPATCPTRAPHACVAPDPTHALHMQSFVETLLPRIKRAQAPEAPQPVNPASQALLAGPAVSPGVLPPGSGPAGGGGAWVQQPQQLASASDVAAAVLGAITKEGLLGSSSAVQVGEDQRSCMQRMEWYVCCDS